MARKDRCADRRACTLGPRQTHEFSCRVARGPLPARGGHRCQDPLECPTLATLAYALEASNLGRERCRPGWTALPAATQIAIRSSRPRRRSLPASAYRRRQSVQGNPASTWVPSRTRHRWTGLCGNHDRIVNWNPGARLSSVNRMTFEPVKWPLRTSRSTGPKGTAMRGLSQELLDVTQPPRFGTLIASLRIAPIGHAANAVRRLSV